MLHSKSTLPFRLTALSLLLLEALPAHAVLPPLSNSPINQLSLVPPNIMFIMDDSGSMDREYVPDEAGGQNGSSIDITSKVGDTNYLCNKLAYNPNYYYTAPLDYQGNAINTAATNSFTSAYDNGFGGTGGTKRNLSNYAGYGYYYQLKSTSTPPTGYDDAKCAEAADNVTTSTNFTRVNINDPSIPATGNAGAPNSKQNYANWFAYYRKRVLMMKTAVGSAFQSLGPEVRFGYMTISTSQTEINGTGGNKFLPMAPMVSDPSVANNQKSLFYSRFYGMPLVGSTPLLAALSGAGLYYAGKYPHDPMLANGQGGECQRNFTILSTDGYWNSYATNPIGCAGCSANLSWVYGNTSGTSVGEQDKDGTSPFSPNSNGNGANASTGKTDGRWAPAASGTLADVAMYYYRNDLRPTFTKLNIELPNNVGMPVTTATAGVVSVDGVKQTATVNVPSVVRGYPYRNMTTYTVGVGVAGTLKYVDNYETADKNLLGGTTLSATNDFINIRNGLKNWPVPQSDKITAADDLWHAAVNGNGTFFSAGDANAMSKGLSATLGKITSDTVKSIAPVTNTPALTQDNNVTYNPNYRSGSWTGRMDAIEIDPETSLPKRDTSNVLYPPIWQAHKSLDLQAGAYDQGTSTSPTTPPVGLVTNGWDTARKIFFGSSTAGSAQPFRWSNLSAAQKATFQDGVSTPSDYGQRVLEYIRGSQDYEEDVSGVHNQVVANQYFRGRGDDTTSAGGDKTQGILGDIVNSKPIVVKGPDEVYDDTNNPGYSNFKTTNANRTPMVYVGSNDGMLHAFNASTQLVAGRTVATANSGREEWAYIPSMLIRGTTDENGKKDGLQSYSYPLGGNPALGIPKFEKHFFVDGLIRVNDVDFNRTDPTTGGVNTTSPDWRSLLVGSLNKGGKGYFALDVTKGDVTNAGASLTETTAANKFLWEFTDADMGYSYGNAVISRHATYGWITAVTSGYNNSSGNGYIWVLNARSGQVIQKFTISSSCTGSNCAIESGLSATNPLNLGRIVGYVYSTASEQLLAIYGGDMQGNVWRIDVSDANKTNWTIKKLAKLTSPAGNGVYGTSAQPITMAPTVQYELSTDRRWVFVGTGMDLSKDDRDTAKPQANQRQTMYALIDGTGPTPLPDSALPIQRSQLVPVTNTSVAAVTLTTSQNRGWMIDLDSPATGTLAERIVLQPVARFGAVVFTSSTPVTDVCAPGYTGKAYARGYLDGQLGSSFIQQNGNYVASVYSAAGYAANPGLVQLAKPGGGGGGATKLQACDLKGNCTLIDLIFPGLTGQSRVSWRELLNQ